jgi:AraC-like DNA-binding protein
MDALSELLRVVKLSGAVFFNAECAAPWCVKSPPSARIAPYVGFPGCHVIEFHLIAAGTGYIRVGTETTPLTAGDIVMLPHGDMHFMGNGIGVEPMDAEADLESLLRGELAVNRLGGPGEKTGLICGYLACDARLIQPVLAGLPRVLRVPLRVDASGEWLENSIRHALTQVSSGAPGSNVIVARLAEVLFAETLRRYILQLPTGRTGWLAAAGDAAIGRALAALHNDPSREWSLDELAKIVGVSRSALTERFARYLGQSPMTYLAEWRLELAAESLRRTSRSVMQIASEVGYDSEAAFNRAFKRRFGNPPALYRRQLRASRS